jgi:hypothetical protein
MAETYFGFDLDDSWDEMWHEVERIQDGGANHHVSFCAATRGEAARLMADRLVPFIEKHMYLSDEDGHVI